MMGILEYSHSFVLEKFKRYYISMLDQNTHDTSSLHTHDYYEFLFIVQGDIIHYCNGEESLLKEGTFVLIRPGDVHRIKPKNSAEFGVLNIIVPVNLLELLLEYLGPSFHAERLLETPQPAVTVLGPVEFQHIVKESNRLCFLHYLSQDEMDYLFRSFILSILANYFPAPHTQKQAEMPVWFQNVIYKMMQLENFREGLPAIQRLCHCTPEYFARLCRKFSGKTPTELINEFRLSYAATELVNSDSTVLDICQNAGFNNLSHFYHLFKAHYGMTPLQFRKSAVKVTTVPYKKGGSKHPQAE